MQVLNTQTLDSIFNKTESRINDLHIYRQLLISIKSFEDFSFNKIKFTQFFFDIEDDLRESLNNTKSSYLSLKEIRDQLEITKNKNNLIEIKYKNADKYICELQEHIKDYLEQINFLENLKFSNEKLIKEHENKIKDLQHNLKISLIENSSHHKESRHKEGSNILNTTSNLNFNNPTHTKAYNETIEKEEYKKTENSNYVNSVPNTNVITSELNTINLNNNLNCIPIKKNFYNGNDESLNTSTLSKIKDKISSNNQYNDIMSEREYSKKLIDDYLKDTLNLNYNNYFKEENKILAYEDNKNHVLPSNKNHETFTNFEKENILNNYNNDLKNNEQEELCKFSNYSNISKPELVENNNKNIQDNSQKNSFKFYNINENNSNNNYENVKNTYQIKGNKNILKEKETFNNNNQNNFNPKKNLDEIQENKYDDKVKTNLDNSNEENISRKHNKSLKADKILDIIVKIRSSEDISSLIYQLFGDDILEKIISPDADELLVEDIESTIQEIEKLMQKEENNENEQQFNDNQKKSEIINSLIIEEKEEESTVINNTLNKDNNNYPNNQKNLLYDDVEPIIQIIPQKIQMETNKKNSMSTTKNSFDLISNINCNSPFIFNSPINNNPNNFSGFSKMINNNNYSKNICNLNDISKNSYDIISDNNLKKSNFKYKTNNYNNNSTSNRSFSKKMKEKCNPECSAALMKKFEESLRNYNERDDIRLNTIGNVNKVFKNYMKNRGDFFDPDLQKGGESVLDNSKKRNGSRSKPKNQNNSKIFFF